MATLSGQVETMRESFDGLFSGIALAVVLVYLPILCDQLTKAGPIR